VLDPVDFLRRLARLIPAPRANLVRYGGAFSPNSAMRDRIVPRLPKPRCTHAKSKSVAGDSGDKTSESMPARETAAEQAGATVLLSASVAPEQDLPPALLGPPLSPEQQLALRDRYLDWASLFKRVFNEDVLLCPRCGHRPMRVIAAIDDPPLVEHILAHLGLPTERPVIAPARSPPQLDFDDDWDDFGDSESEFDVN
jgi:hypothetical protein